MADVLTDYFCNGPNSPPTAHLLNAPSVESLITPLHFSAPSLSHRQPVDVGINHPIKMEMTEQWEKWMFNGGRVIDGVAKEPTRKLVAEWTIGTYRNISVETGKNAWKKTGYEWFN